MNLDPEELAAGRLLASAEAEAEQMLTKADELAEVARREGAVTILLSSPVTIGEGAGARTITSLRLRKMLTGDQRRMGARPTPDELLTCAGKLCGEVDAVINQLDVEDGLLLQSVVGSFFRGSRATRASN